MQSSLFSSVQKMQVDWTATVVMNNGFQIENILFR